MQLPKLVRNAALSATALCLALQADTDGIQLPDSIVTATPEARATSTVAAPVTVITRAEIEESRALDVPDLLRAIGGIEVIDITGSRGRTTSIDMRGFGETSAANLAVVVDGRTVTGPTGAARRAVRTTCAAPPARA